uniref:Ovule protein n=1 Tax=Brugia timori TaxID=42155 RepID=A0A0R3QE19_9BILA
LQFCIIITFSGFEKMSSAPSRSNLSKKPMYFLHFTTHRVTILHAIPHHTCYISIIPRIHRDIFMKWCGESKKWHIHIVTPGTSSFYWRSFRCCNLLDEY